MRKHIISCVLMVAAITLASASAASADDKWIGKWKLNVEKSKFSPAPGPQSQTVTFEAAGKAIKLTSDSVSADGKAMHTEYTSSFDGKDVPWTGNPDADMASPKRIDAASYENVWKKGGKATITSKVTVSADGKTLTIVQSGQNAEGKAAASTLVFDRQ